jgi:hypothetical protein
MLTPALIVWLESGNFIGKIISHGVFTDESLQWIKVSSRSKIIVVLNLLDGSFCIFC